MRASAELADHDGIRPGRPPRRLKLRETPRAARVRGLGAARNHIMSLAGLLGVIAEDPELQRALRTAREAGVELIAPPALRPFIAAFLAESDHLNTGSDDSDDPADSADLAGPADLADLAGPADSAGPAGSAGSAGPVSSALPPFVLAVTATGREAEDLTAALSSLLPAHSVACFPAWETLPNERLSPRSDTVGQRLAVLRRLAHPVATDPAFGPLRVVVAPVRSLLQPLVAGLGDIEPIRLRQGDDADLDDVVTRLAGAGYT